MTEVDTPEFRTGGVKKGVSTPFPSPGAKSTCHLATEDSPVTPVVEMVYDRRPLPRLSATSWSREFLGI